MQGHPIHLAPLDQSSRTDHALLFGRRNDMRTNASTLSGTQTGEYPVTLQIAWTLSLRAAAWYANGQMVSFTGRSARPSEGFRIDRIFQPPDQQAKIDFARREVAARPSRAADAVRAVFSEGGACYDCHTIFPPAAGNNWRVMAVNQTPRFLTKGWFDHDAHREIVAPVRPFARAFP